jgi:hypothetical protein
MASLLESNIDTPTIRARKPAADTNALTSSTSAAHARRFDCYLQLMVRLELSEDEARELSEALAAQLHSLRFELTAADARQFRHDLRERLNRLERVAALLAREAADSGAQPFVG